MVDVNYKNGSVFINTVCDDNYRAIKLLIDNGVNIHINNDDAICIAAELGMLHICKLLIKYGGYETIHAQGEKPLDLAISGNHYEIAKLLLENGAIIYSDDWLMKFVEANNYKMGTLLLDYEQDIHKNNDEVLKILVKYGNYNMSKLLLDHSLKINKPYDVEFLLKLLPLANRSIYNLLNSHLSELQKNA